jgi:hypothetical protein
MCGKQPKAAHVYLFSKIDATLNSKTFKRTKILKNKTHTQDSQSIQTTQSNSNEQITNIAQFSPSTVILL